MKSHPYIIPFKGLKAGKHLFEYTLPDTFFEEHEAFDSNGGKVFVNLELIKKDQLMELSFQFKGNISIICDRCLEYFNFPFRLTDSFYVRFHHGESEFDNEIWQINNDEFELDLTQYLYDLVGASLPISKKHPDDKDGSPTCNELLNLLDENTDTNEDNIIDPRWSKLKDLLDKK